MIVFSISHGSCGIIDGGWLVGDIEMPEEFKHLTPEKQQQSLRWTIAWNLTTLLITIFTDSPENVMSNLG